MSNLEAERLHQQRTTSGVSEEWETEATITVAQLHQNWTIADWKNVSWSDESQFLLQNSHVNIYIYIFFAFIRQDSEERQESRETGETHILKDI